MMKVAPQYEALWSKVEAFDFDRDSGVYPFSVRLQHENVWTRNFTILAILEYKKFMLLAAISEQMVSPSEVIDVVWHQHIVFTKSYQDFCELLGKQIQHIPATGKKGEKAQFETFRQKTIEKYNEVFGETAPSVWHGEGMVHQLGLPKSRYKLRWVITVSILIWMLILPIFLGLTESLITSIKNPAFLFGYMSVGVVLSVCMVSVSGWVLKQPLKGVPSDAFLFQLSPEEILYLKYPSRAALVVNAINQLIYEDCIVHANGNFQSIAAYNGTDLQLKVLSVFLQENGPVSGKDLVRYFNDHLAFVMTENAIKLIRKYYIRSAFFVRIFNINLNLILLFLNFGLARLILGLERNKMVFDLSKVLLLFALASGFWLFHLSKAFIYQKIHVVLRRKLLDETPADRYHDFGILAFGSAMLFSAVRPLFESATGSGNSGSGGCGSGCGGGGCGGCGGCGG